MKPIILTILLAFVSIHAGAQYFISCDHRTYCKWNNDINTYDEYEIKKISDIPDVIAKSLADSGTEKITFDFNDLEEIMGNRDLPVLTDGKDISTLIYNRIDKADTATVNITDYVLYYRVRIKNGVNRKPLF